MLSSVMEGTRPLGCRESLTVPGHWRTRAGTINVSCHGSAAVAVLRGQNPQPESETESRAFTVGEAFYGKPAA